MLSNELPSGIPWVDNDEAPHPRALCPGGVEGPLNLRDVQRPSGLFLRVYKMGVLLGLSISKQEEFGEGGRALDAEGRDSNHRIETSRDRETEMLYSGKVERE